MRTCGRRCYTRIVEWLRDNWIKVHLAVSPLGTLIVTWILAIAVGAGQWWSDRSSLELTGQTVPLGGVIYGSCILVLEVTGRMLWALAQRQKDIDKAKQEERELILRQLAERGIQLPPEILKDIKDLK